MQGGKASAAYCITGFYEAFSVIVTMRFGVGQRLLL
jgi:hypothetical protein